MNWLYYVAEANIYLGVFYLAYCVLLAKETHYQLNRAYLVLSCVASFVLPVLQIGALKPVEVAVNTTINYPVPVVMEPTVNVIAAPQVTPVVTVQHLSLQDYLLYAYITGCVVVFFMLMVKLIALLKLAGSAQRVEQDKYKVAYLPGTNTAFSFFNYLFIGANAAGSGTIIRHELVHIRQRHSADILFIELLKILSWFNPIVYLIQNSLKTVHEYIADEQTAAYETDALTYSSFLLDNAYGTGGSSITHSFFNYSLLKKRILMLNRQRSGKLAMSKYLVSLPICVALLCASTLTFSKTYGWIDLDPAKAQNDIALPRLAYEDSHKGIVISLKHENTVLGFNDPKANTAPPLLIANGKRYELAKLKHGYSVIFSADSTTQYNKGNRYALATWGPAAENGVLLLHGDKASVQISAAHLPETLHLNFLPDTTKYKYPPPSVFKKGFGRLMGHIQHSFTYTDALRNEKNSFVGVSFTVKADRTITDINVFKKAGNAFDDIAKAAFASFDEVVTTKPGKHTLMINYYSQKGDQQADPDAGSKYDVNLVVAPPKPGTIPIKFPPPVVRPETKQTGKIRSNTYIDKYGGRVSVGRLNNAQVPITSMLRAEPTLLFILNDTKYDIDPEQLKEKTLIAMSYDSITVYEKGNAYARTKWGNNVGKVAVLHGKASLKLINW